MKHHKLLILVLVAAAALAFGANSAFGSNIFFDPKTKTYTYVATVDDTQQYRIKVRRAGSVGFTDYTAIEYNWWDVGVPFGDTGVRDYCFNDAGYIACPAKKVEVYTADGNDTITGASDLSVSTALHGGKGIDTITGGGGADLLDGGEGADQLFGGGGVDLADYSSRRTFVNASLDSSANDGEPGELDLIGFDVEGIQGGGGDDILYGNGSLNVLKGGPGDDYLSGQGGNDVLFGQAGSDTLRGGYGADSFYGGTDTSSSCCSVDAVTWSERSNPIFASIDGLGNDGEAGEGDYVGSDVEALYGSVGNDTLTGDGHANKLFGGVGNDTLNGNGGGGTDGHPELVMGDELDGGSQADVLDGGPASTLADKLDGGDGIDRVTYASRGTGVEIHLDGTSGGEDKIANVENATGGNGNDAIIGDSDANWIFGGFGNDSIAGLDGADVLHAGDGNDAVYGNGGNDVVAGDQGADTLSGGLGGDLISGHEGLDTATYADYTVPVTVSLNDNVYDDGAAGEADRVLDDVETVIGGSAADKLVGSAGPNTLIGGNGADTLFGLGGSDLLQGGTKNDLLYGGEDSDTLEGGNENDELNGGTGYDTLRGGPDDDQLNGGADGDYADYSSAGSPVTVDLAAGTAVGQGSDTMSLVENVYGSNNDDTLRGDEGSNVISGFAGNDTIVGHGGADQLFGAAGDDLLRGEAGNDQLSGGAGVDTVDYTKAPAGVTVDISTYAGTASGGDGSDFLSYVEDVTGSPFADSITGSSVANVLLGGAGDDKLAGLAGDDKLDGGLGIDSLDGGLDTDSCLSGETLTSCE